MSRFTGSVGRDPNRVPATYGVLNTDGITTKPLELDSASRLLTLSTLTDGSGHNVTVTGGKLDVNATISGTAGGTSTVDKGVFNVGVDSGTPNMGVYQSALDTVSDGHAAVVGLTNKRGMFVNLQTSTGAETGVAATPLQVSLANTGANATAVKVDASSANVTVVGNKTHNNAAPGATNIGALVAIANNAAPTYTEGDEVLLSTDLSGNVRVTGSLSIGGTTDNSAFTAGTSTGTPSMGFYHSTIDAVTDGRAAALAIDSKRNLHVSLFDAAGNARAANVNASNQLSVSVDNNPVLGAGSAVIGHVITDANSVTLATTNADAAIGAGTAPSKALVAGAVYNSTEISPSTGQTFALQADSKGRLRNVIMDAAGNTRGANVTASNELLVNVNNVPAVTATLAAETTKVIGTVRTADGSGNLLTSTGNALDVNLKTSSITLNVSAAQSGNWTSRIVGNAGATLDATVGAAAAPTNMLAVGGVYNSTEISPSTGQSAAIQLDSKGRQRMVIMDAAANTRGVNVTAANELLVSVNNSTLAVTQSGSWTVTANAGTNLNTSALALESGGNLATIAGAIIAQEATTSGVKGITAFGAVTTNAPTYTTAKSDALSLDTSGLLRVSLKDTPANTTNLNVNLAASSATVTVTATNLSTNIAQVAGNTASTAASGTLLVGLADGAGNKVTSNSTTYSSKIAPDVNILGTLGTAFTTAGFVDIKGADGNVFVRQATAANLNATVVGTLTNNNAAPSSTNFGVLPAIAGQGPQTYLAGDQVLLTTDLSGNLNAKVNNVVTVNHDQISGVPIVTSQPGVQAVTLADDVGNLISSVGQRLAVHARGVQDATEDSQPSLPYLNSALSNTLSMVRAGRTNVYFVNLINTNVADTYIQVFDVTGPSQVTIGTTPPTDVWLIPAAGSSTVAGAFEEAFTVPLTYLRGLYITATTTATGSSAPTTGVVVNLRTSA